MKNQFLKKIILHPLGNFLFHFVFFGLFMSLMNYNDFDLKSILFQASFFGFWMALFNHFTVKAKIPYYFKPRDYEKVLEIVQSLNTVLIKEKEGKMQFKLRGERWPNNKLWVKKNPFYILVEFPEKYKKLFDDLDTLNQKLD